MKPSLPTALLSTATAALVLLATPLPGLCQAAPALQPGETFRYQAQSATPQSGTAPVAIGGMPLPTEMTVSILAGDPQDAPDEPLVLEASQKLGPLPIPVPDQSNSARITAQIDRATGGLLEIDSTFTLLGQSRQIRSESIGVNASFADFFGPWMLEIGERSVQEYELGNGARRVYRVRGQEEIAGRRCFVVERLTDTGDGQVVHRTYWIDAERRYMVQVEEGSWRLTLTPEAAHGEHLV
jgi:hypothetical protein